MDTTNGNNNNGVKPDEVATNAITTPPRPQENWLKKIWKMKSLITVEPLVVCWVLPSCFLIAAMENIGLEKTCRVNLGLSEEICDNMINKTINDISCQTLIDEGNSTAGDVLMSAANLLLNTTMFESMQQKQYIEQLTRDVCKAEEDSQKEVAVIIGYRSPISAIFPLIIILFAGGWSDRKGIRKPCMLFPLIGDFLGCISLLISAIFMYELPMEFGAILEKVIPAMFGGTTLMLMGIYSYLTCITSEENRTFRFGCFTAFVTIIPILATPFAGVLYESLGYIKLFLLCIVIYFIGIMYIMFCLPEVKSTESTTTTTSDNKIEMNGVDNAAFEGATDTTRTNGHDHASSPAGKQNGERKNSTRSAEIPKRRCNFLFEFFDPTLALDCLNVLKRKRENGRAIIFMCVACYFIFFASLGENEYFYQFTRLQLNWSAVDLGFSITYSTVVSLVGTLFMITVLSKLLKLSDPMLGILSSILTIISRPFMAWATTSLMFYTGLTVDFLVSAKAIAIKTVISRNVEPDELGRVYSILGITDAIDLFVFPFLYSLVYYNSVDKFRGAIYMMSELFFITTLILFIMIYMKERKNKKDADEEKNIETPPAVPSERYTESTYM